MRSIIRLLPTSLAHELAPLGLQFYAELFGVESTPMWRPLNWKGLHFPNRLGLAGGVDKNAEYLDLWSKLGCGFVEAGTVTPRAQKPNSGKIMARDWDKQNLWNRMGFPSAGAREVAMNLYHHQPKEKIPVFINIGRNRDTDNRYATGDYLDCVELLKDFADAFVLNVSSPNTKGLRELQNKAILTALSRDVVQASSGKPVLLKLSPDLSSHELHDGLDAGINSGASGFILTNTTLSRPENCPFPMDGGLAGKALAETSKSFLLKTAGFLGDARKDLLIVSVGGILSYEDVLERLEMGADLVEVYSALVFQGPRFFKHIADQFRKNEPHKGNFT
jgi:dihydroorotate dehydrogenase